VGVCTSYPAPTTLHNGTLSGIGTARRECVVPDTMTTTARCTCRCRRTYTCTHTHSLSLSFSFARSLPRKSGIEPARRNQCRRTVALMYRAKSGSFPGLYRSIDRNKSVDRGRVDQSQCEPTSKSMVCEKERERESVCVCVSMRWDCQEHSRRTDSRSKRWWTERTGNLISA
jgi:hypothetical protein